MKKIVVVGGGGHAKVVISILKKSGIFEVAGYTDSHDNGPILGASYLGDDQILEQIYKNQKVEDAVIGLGQVGNPQPRKRLSDLLKKIGFHLPPIISPYAIVNEDVHISEGTVLMDGVVVNTGTRIGAFCIINTRTSIDHDCTLGDFVHIAPGAVLSGGVTVGDNTLIGSGAAVIHAMIISNDCILGAGAVVVRDINQPGIYVGNPARRKNG